MVRNGGHVLQQRYGRRRLSFLTVTLPSMEHEAAVRVAETWGETVRQLQQWLSRTLKRRGLPSSIVLVTELQTRRLRGGDSAALHLHAVFVGRHASGPWLISPKEVRQWWTSRLSRVTDSEVSSPNCVDMKQVQRDAGNYLSKYMSKGTSDIEEFAEAVGWNAVPRQWWNMTAEVRAMVKRGCLTSERIMQVLDQCVKMWYEGDADAGFKFVRAIEVSVTEYQSFVVGFWGRLTKSGIADLTDLATCAKSA